MERRGCWQYILEAEPQDGGLDLEVKKTPSRTISTFLPQQLNGGQYKLRRWKLGAQQVREWGAVAGGAGSGELPRRCSGHAALEK